MHLHAAYLAGDDPLVAPTDQGATMSDGPQDLPSPVAHWHVPDIEAKLAAVTAAGATVKDAPREVGGGRLVATFTDPDGNVLGLIQDS
jgi:predicted enzyme related to lactoylglutathione lyase